MNVQALPIIVVILIMHAPYRRAHFEIDHVRVYQAVNNSKRVLGCSTRPTDLFITVHARRYMAEGDTMPLRPARRCGDPLQ
jgi:hypothetical protein